MSKPHITISGSIKCENLPNDLYETILNVFKLENPMYEKLRRMGNDRAMRGMKKHFMYYILSDEGKTIDELGRGAEKFLKQAFIMEGIEHTFEHKTVKVALKEEFKSDSLVLRDYQEGVLDEVNENVGVLKLACGFGKTLISLKLVEKFQQRTLIVVPRTHLRDQFSAEIEKYYGFKPQTLSGDKKVKRFKKTTIVNEVDEDTPIVLATVQTLQSMKKKGELYKWKNKFGMIVADEAQGYITDKSRAVFREFNAHYLYGMTATPERTDQQTSAVFFTFGSILVERELPTALPRVLEYKVKAHVPVMEYADMILEMVENEERNKEIANVANEQIKQGRKVLMLTKRVAHLDLIEKHMNKDDLIKVYAGDKDKSEVLSSLKKGDKDFKCIGGTVALMGTGLDIPELDALILCSDLKSSVLTKQASGRILRAFEGKDDPIIIDFHDASPILHRQHLARKKVYKENGWKFEEHSV